MAASKKTEYELYRSKSSTNWLPWLILTVVIGLLLLFFLYKALLKPNIIGSYDPNVPINNQPIFPNNPDRGHTPFPGKPNILPPIDTSKIRFDPDDPLKRKYISDLINLYLTDTTDLKAFYTKLINTFPNDSITATYYADEYKRIQIRVDEQKRENIRNSIKAQFKEVKFVCDEALLSNAQSPPSDPGFRDMDNYWFYQKIGLFDAWNRTKGDSSVTVAIIDDSFDPNHVEFKGKIVEPWNVYNYSDKVTTWGGMLQHGTHVAGSAIANINNGKGISGVAPGCKLMPIQIADRNGMMTTSSILDGVFYALKNKADVINMSLGININHMQGLTDKQQKAFISGNYIDEAAMWDEVYHIAEKEGVVIVQAAGNSSVLAMVDPMKRSKASIIVGALDQNQRIAKFSNYGENVTIYAPGENIYSSIPNGRFGTKDGTSMASPIIAGCIALMKSVDKNITLEEIQILIAQQGTAVPGEKGVMIRIDHILNQLP